MSYTIKELAKIANSSVRTLHHYDAIGLLVPVRDKRNQYRIYNEAELLRLQQILFFRELDFGLDEIEKILQSPAFDMVKALREHRSMIILKKKRLDALVETIDKTINKVTKNKSMKDEELYDSFSNEEMEELAKESKERWGNTEQYKESEKKMRSMTKEQMDVIRKEGDEISKEAATLIGKDVSSAEVQELIKKHYKHLSNFYTPNKDMYRGLAEMYIGDTRFKSYFETYHPELPQFMYDAMIWFVENNK